MDDLDGSSHGHRPLLMAHRNHPRCWDMEPVRSPNNEKNWDMLYIYLYVCIYIYTYISDVKICQYARAYLYNHTFIDIYECISIYTCICHCYHSIIIISIIIIPRSLLPLIWVIYIYISITIISLLLLLFTRSLTSLLSCHYYQFIIQKNLRAYTYYDILCIYIYIYNMYI